MTATNEQIIREAHRRQNADVDRQELLSHFIIEVTRENWTPPEPVVDPDVLAFREWAVTCLPEFRAGFLGGSLDSSRAAQAYLAGARMAREQEQADMHIPVIAVELATRFRHLLHSLPLNVRVQLGVKWDLDDAFVKGVEVTLAKYRGEA
jgi:hypothetical protein